MFTGEYKHVIDTKNRLSIPAKFRDKLSGLIYITKGFDHCLFVFTEAEWHLFQKKIKSLPLSSAKSRAFTRIFFAGAVECELDKQGRVILPQNLRDHAKLQKDVYVNGAGDRIEIWDACEWEEYTQSMASDMDSLAEEMAGLGIDF